MPLILTGAMLAGGCATKKYVRNTTSPIQTKVEQVGEQTNRNATDIAEARKETKAVDERAETGISAARERAMTAEGRANEAMGKATEAGTLAATAKTSADKANSDVGELRGELRSAVSNIDDYKKAAETTVTFKFNSADLSKEAKEALDGLAANKANMKRFVVSVEGFTDRTGPADYNTALSQRRANAVVNYLVSKHDIPVYRIYTVGLGKDKPVDDGKTREARSKSRRVEVKIFSADQTMAMSPSSGSNTANPTR